MVAAGLYNTPVRTVLGYRVLAAATLAGFGALLGHELLVRMAIAGVSGPLRLDLPVTYLRRRAKQRALAIERAIPNLIDQIVVSLEAGMGFSASLQTWTDRLEGPLGDEMRLALQEQRMGASLTESLQHLRERVESQNLQSFVRAVVQGERLGVSLGPNHARPGGGHAQAPPSDGGGARAEDAGQAADPAGVPHPAHDLHRRAGPAGAQLVHGF